MSIFRTPNDIDYFDMKTKELIDAKYKAAVMAQPYILPPNPPRKYDHNDLLDMVTSRLHDKTINVTYINLHKIDDTKVVAFIVQRGDPVIIEDVWDLFPSDSFMTKLRVVIGAG